MRLGPTQQLWINSLRENWHRQMKDKLGEGTEKDYKACCLGEGLMVLYREGKISECPIEDDKIISTGKDIRGIIMFNEHSGEEIFEYSLLGLKGTQGELKEPVELEDFFPKVGANKRLGSLAEMNDNGISWVQIADYIENNPENVFNESL